MSLNKFSLAAVCLCGMICSGIGVILGYRYTALDTSHWTTADAISEMVDHPAAAAAVLRRHDDAESKLALAMDIGLFLPDPETHKDEINALLNDGEPAPLGMGFDGTAASFIPYLDQQTGGAVKQFPLTCKMILRYPVLLNGTYPITGGHRDDWNAFVNCTDNKYRLPASVTDYASALDALSGYGGFCGASGDFADQTRLVNSYFALIVQYAPRSLLPPYTDLGDGQNEMQNFAVSPNSLPLQGWGETDIDSYKKAKAVGIDFLKARADLASYYQSAFGLSPSDAQSAAMHGIWLLENALQWANGRSADPLAEALLGHQPLTKVEAALVNESPAPASILFLAVQYPEALKILLTEHPDLTVTTPIGKTVLMEAAKYNQLESVTLLLAAGADVNAVSQTPDQIDNNVEEGDENDGQDCWTLYNITHGSRTALMYAAANANLSVINALLAAGADTEAKDSTGLDALDYLKGRGPVSKNSILNATDFKIAAQELALPNPHHIKLPPSPAKPAGSGSPQDMTGQVSI